MCSSDLSYFVLDSKYAVRDLYLFYDTDSTFTYAQQYLVDLVLTRFSQQERNELGR